MSADFRVLGSRRVGTGAFLTLERVHLLAPDGRSHLRDVVHHPGGVAVLPVDGDRLWLIRQYRAPVGRPILEIPAGVLDRLGESLEETAARELEEELGMRAARISPLGRMLPSPGYTDETIHLYLAEGIVTGRRRPDGAEEHHSEAVELTFDHALALLERGEIEDAKTQLALAAWARRKG